MALWLSIRGTPFSPFSPCGSGVLTPPQRCDLCLVNPLSLTPTPPAPPCCLSLSFVMTSGQISDPNQADLNQWDWILGFGGGATLGRKALFLVGSSLIGTGLEASVAKIWRARGQDISQAGGLRSTWLCSKMIQMHALFCLRHLELGFCYLQASRDVPTDILP